MHFKTQIMYNQAVALNKLPLNGIWWVFYGFICDDVYFMYITC